jgi:3-deoxy-7-phosphoheptulonate synthase
VLPLARAAVAVGCDGLIVEVHHAPDRALSDGAQSLYPEQFEQLMNECSQIAEVVQRRIPRDIEVTSHEGAASPAGR